MLRGLERYAVYAEVKEKGETRCVYYGAPDRLGNSVVGGGGRLQGSMVVS